MLRRQSPGVPPTPPGVLPAAAGSRCATGKSTVIHSGHYRHVPTPQAPIQQVPPPGTVGAFLAMAARANHASVRASVPRPCRPLCRRADQLPMPRRQNPAPNAAATKADHAPQETSPKQTQPRRHRPEARLPNSRPAPKRPKASQPKRSSSRGIVRVPHGQPAAEGAEGRGTPGAEVEAETRAEGQATAGQASAVPPGPIPRSRRGRAWQSRLPMRPGGRFGVDAILLHVQGRLVSLREQASTPRDLLGIRHQQPQPRAR